MNTLYFADCLDVLKELDAEHGGQGFIDLIYIDPPFNSKRNYNVLFESLDMKDATAQKQAFSDTWSNYSYMDTLNEIADLDRDLYEFLNTLHKIRTSDSAVAYLTTMSIRIWYMHKLLKYTGSFYLHCDPTMSGYLRMICDLIFGEKNFRNEIVWKRTSSKGLAFTRYASNHDIIFYYSKSHLFTWNPQYKRHDEEYVNSFYDNIEPETGRKYALDNLANPNKDRPNLTYEFLGVKRVWRWTKERMEEAYKKGLIIQSKKGSVPRLKRYLDEQEGNPIDDTWIDIKPIQSKTSESLGYPTQKPISLMERIIQASSNKGDLVADFFCGCGTTIAAAEKLNRKWLGADISHLAIRLIVKRLVDTYGEGIKHNIIVKGFPKDIESAKALAIQKNGRAEFEEWIVEFLLNGVLNEKRPQGGYDGYLTFEMPDKKEFVLIEVKSGGVTIDNFRAFTKVVETQKAAMGIFVSFETEITKGMEKIAKEAGYYRPEMFEKQYPRIQIMTVEDLLKHYQPRMPESKKTTFKSAQRSKDEKKVSGGLFD